VEKGLMTPEEIGGRVGDISARLGVKP
jgi:hypothetical protein